MKFNVIIEPDCEEEITLKLREKSDLEEKIRALLKENERAIVGYGEREIKPLNLREVGCFFVEGGRTYATVGGGRFRVDMRIYELEERLGEDFVKVNQSCIVNVGQIERFDASFAGSLIVVMKDGMRECISRRQLKTVKERIGFKL